MGARMVRTVAQRLGMIIAVMFVVTIGTSALVDLIPGSPAALILGDTSAPGAIEKFNHEHGYDRPFLTRYWDWLTSALHGDFGMSVQRNESVTHVIASHVGVSLEIAVLAMLVSLVIAVPLAMYCGAREGNVVDRVVTAVSSGLFSSPSFVTAVFLSTIFAAKFQIFPIYGWVPLGDSVFDNLRSAAMPVMCLAISITPLFLRVLRADVVSMLREDFVLNARAKGLPDHYILARHVFRPASVSLFTISALVFGYLLGGSIVIETYFSIPGLGHVVSEAVTGHDIPVVQGIVVVVAVIFLVLNTLVDASYRLLDPRVATNR